MTALAGSTGAVLERVVTDAGGRTAIIREGSPADRDAMAALYATLDAEDRSTRFFSAACPKSFVDRWCRIGEGGGLLLVACPSDDPTTIVADGGFVPLPNGDAEWGLTVSKAWRGGLGTAMFEALLDEAAARAIPNLEGDILTRNAPMLAVARRHGLAVLAHPDQGMVRVVVGTATATPTWPVTHDRPRVLVEGATLLPAVADALRAEGYDVLVCPGPPRDDAERCPLVREERCPLVDDADMVVFARGAGVDDPVVAAHRRDPGPWRMGPSALGPPLAIPEAESVNQPLEEGSDAH